VRRGGPSRPPTIDERADALHLRSGPYDIGFTRARELDRGCRVNRTVPDPRTTVAPHNERDKRLRFGRDHDPRIVYVGRVVPSRPWIAIYSRRRLRLEVKRRMQVRDS
jgi:hypothetical protein